MRLRVVTPARGLVDAEVTEVTAPGIEGEIGLLPEHVTFLGGLDVGVLSYDEGGSTRRLVVDGGYVEVSDDTITVLADAAEQPDEIDAGAARSELADLERALDASDEGPEQVADLLRQIRRAHVRAEVAS